MFQTDRPISLANAEKLLNFQRSVRGRYCTALSYDVIHAAYLFCLHLR